MPRETRYNYTCTGIASIGFFLSTTNQGDLLVCIVYMQYSVLIIYLHFSFTPRDHNKNKVQLDLYYAIPATVILDVVYLYMLFPLSFLFISI